MAKWGWAFRPSPAHVLLRHTRLPFAEPRFIEPEGENHERTVLLLSDARGERCSLQLSTTFGSTAAVLLRELVPPGRAGPDAATYAAVHPRMDHPLWKVVEHRDGMPHVSSVLTKFWTYDTQTGRAQEEYVFGADLGELRPLLDRLDSPGLETVLAAEALRGLAALHATGLLLGEVAATRVRLGVEPGSAPLRLCGWWTTVRRGTDAEQLEERRRVVALFPRAEGIDDAGDAATQHARACARFVEPLDRALEQAATTLWEEVDLHATCLLERIPPELRER